MRLILPLIEIGKVLDQIILLIVLARRDLHVAIVLDKLLKLFYSDIFKFDVLFRFPIDSIVSIKLFL